MKIFRSISVLFISLASFAFPLSLLADEEMMTKQNEKMATKQNTESTDQAKSISTEELKKMIDSKQPALIIDARKHNNGGLIPGAKSLPYNASDDEIKAFLATIPKETVIVIYCSNIYCPVSGYLAKRLVLLGYPNLYKYSEGLSGWLEKGYPTDPEPSTNEK